MCQCIEGSTCCNMLKRLITELRSICHSFVRRLRPADEPRNVTGAFAAADWMFSIAPGGGVSASAAASLRFKRDQDDSSDDSEPPLHMSRAQLQRITGPAGAQALPQLPVERDPSSHAASAMDPEPRGDAVKQRLPAPPTSGEDLQPAQPPRRRVSFANRLPPAARTPLASGRGAGGAEAQDGARATAEWVAAQVYPVPLCREH